MRSPKCRDGENRRYWSDGLDHLKSMPDSVNLALQLEKKQQSMNKNIQAYNDSQSKEDREICNLLYDEINNKLPEAEYKIWHAHPVWFLEGNPIVGYSKLKNGVRLMFWSGAGFDEKKLQPGTGKFKDASIYYTATDQIDREDLKRWLEKSRVIQWDYKNVVKRKGVLERLK